GQCQSYVIDGNHAALDGRPDEVSGFGRLGPSVSREPVWQAIGFSNSVTKLREGNHHGHRPERLVVHYPAFLRGVGEDRRREVVALVSNLIPAGLDLSAIFNG